MPLTTGTVVAGTDNRLAAAKGGSGGFEGMACGQVAFRVPLMSQVAFEPPDVVIREITGEEHGLINPASKILGA